MECAMVYTSNKGLPYCELYNVKGEVYRIDVMEVN
jgi:hypothetical protein